MGDCLEVALLSLDDSPCLGGGGFLPPSISVALPLVAVDAPFFVASLVKVIGSTILAQDTVGSPVGHTLLPSIYTSGVSKP